MPEWHKQLLTDIYISSIYYEITIVLFYIVYTMALWDTVQKYLACSAGARFADVIIWCIFIILLSIAKMDIFICTKVALPSEFKCDSNELIFSPIGHNLGELHKFYKVFPEMEVFR